MCEVLVTVSNGDILTEWVNEWSGTWSLVLDCWISSQLPSDADAGCVHRLYSNVRLELKMKPGETRMVQAFGTHSTIPTHPARRDRHNLWYCRCGDPGPGGSPISNFPCGHQLHLQHTLFTEVNAGNARI